MHSASEPLLHDYEHDPPEEFKVIADHSQHAAAAPGDEQDNTDFSLRSDVSLGGLLASNKRDSYLRQVDSDDENVFMAVRASSHGARGGGVGADGGAAPVTGPSTWLGNRVSISQSN